MGAIPVLSRDAIRSLDGRAIREFGIPGVVLMENAGRGVAQRIQELEIAGVVAICCGKGNNGGDGFVIARHLHNSGHAIHLILADKFTDWTGDARVHRPQPRLDPDHPSWGDVWQGQGAGRSLADLLRPRPHRSGLRF